MSEHLSSEEIDEISMAYKKAHDEVVGSRDEHKSKAKKVGQQAAKFTGRIGEARVVRDHARITTGQFGRETWELDKEIWELDGEVTQHKVLSQKASSKGAEAERDRKAALWEAKEHFENNRDAYRQAALDSEPEEMAEIAAKNEQSHAAIAETEIDQPHQPAA